MHMNFLDLLVSFCLAKHLRGQKFFLLLYILYIFVCAFLFWLMLSGFCPLKFCACCRRIAPRYPFMGRSDHPTCQLALHHYP